ncbi:MAG: hypothetical protein CL917_06285 [Deltaproteobacteria bacterium]|nr:hypothetical protein [Deltaproteobacteria bacterium]
MSLAESLERAAVEMPEDADAIRPANGDPSRLLEVLEPEARQRVLRWLLQNSIAEAQLLSEVWLEQEEGAAVVASISSEGLPKEGRKALRRLLHRARSQGILVEADEEAEKPRVGRLPQVDESISIGFLSPHDPRGGRLVYLVESNPSGGAQVFEALLDEDRGIVDFQVYRAGRRQVKSFIRDVTHRDRFSAIETEAACVRALIGRRARLQTDLQAFPAAFKEWRGKLDLTTEESKTPAEQVKAHFPHPASEAELADLVSEVQAGNLGPWPPQPGSLETMISPLRDRFASAEVGEHEESREKMTEAVHEAVSACYSAELAATNAERLEESAYLYWKQGQEGHARACLTSAQMLAGAEPELGPAMSECARIVGDALVQDLAASLSNAEAGDPASEEVAI